MPKILVLCVTLGVLIVIAESKPLGITREDCPGCGEYFVQRKSSPGWWDNGDSGGRAPEIIDSVTGLLRNGIMLPTWNGIVQVNKAKMEGKRKTYLIGPGHGNTNRVMFNNNNDDYYDDYNGGNFNNRRNQRNHNYY